MTGLLERLRAWLAGGDDDPSSGEETDAEAADDESDSRVVHRDDRPLETPRNIESPNPSVTPAEDPTPTNRAESASETASSTSGSVSIPDAESLARGDPVASSGASDEPVDGESTVADAETTEELSTEATPSDAADSTTSDDEGDAAFACSVCGTAVDDPESPCPLCRSTDIVPRGDAPTEGGPSQEGRTAVSTADDEAVDRLRDVQTGDEE